MSPNSSPNSTVFRHRRPGTSSPGTYEKNLNCMLVCRRSRLENYWNHFNRFLFIVIIVTYAVNAEETDCRNAYKTCTECTKNSDGTKCKWNVWEQTCAEMSSKDKKWKFSVSVSSSCPNFTVLWQKGNAVVTVSNDQKNLVSSMKDSGPVQCVMDNTRYNAEVDGNQIKCGSEPMTSATSPSSRTKARSMVHLSVVFANGNRTLLFDVISDHYQRLDSASNTSCQTHCGWHDEGFRYYCTWCSAVSPTVNASQYCDKRRYPKLVQLDFDNAVTLNSDRCVPAMIESFNPSFGELFGVTVLEIVVQHHQLLLNTNSEYSFKSAILIVTVAGRDCGSPQMSGNNTITCTLSQRRQKKVKNASHVPLEGHVEVKYSGFINITFVSLQTFKFFEDSTSSSQLVSTTPSLHLSLNQSPPPSQIASSNTSEPQSLNMSMPSSSTPSPSPTSTSSLPQSSTQSSSPSQLPSTTSLPSSSSSSSPPPLQTTSSNQLASTTSNPLRPLSPTVLSFSSSTSPSTTTFPTKANITKEAFNNNTTISRTTPVFSTVVTIVMYAIFIIVLCVALIYLKSPRTYDLLTFHLRQRPMQMRQLGEDQHLHLSITDYDVHDDGYDETEKGAVRDKNQLV